MLDPEHFEIIAGERLVEIMRGRRALLTAPNIRLPLGARTLTDIQHIEAEAGICGAELVETAYGHWVARYDSSLQGSGGLLLGRCSYPEAIAWAEKWQAEDPTHRYVWRRK